MHGNRIQYLARAARQEHLDLCMRIGRIGLYRLICVASLVFFGLAILVAGLWFLFDRTGDRIPSTISELVLKLEQVDRRLLSQMASEELRLRLSLSPGSLELAATLDRLPQKGSIRSQLPDWTGLSEPRPIGREEAIELILMRLARTPKSELAAVVGWLHLYGQTGGKTDLLLEWYLSLGSSARERIDTELRTDGLTPEEIAVRSHLLALSSLERDGLTVLLRRMTPGILAQLSRIPPDRLMSLINIAQSYAGSFSNEAAAFPCLNRPERFYYSDPRLACSVIVVSN
ncbi:hypothetical protein [Pacificispira sp.]|uniref:hypothetical protein n=1 Tax=Pacificispira sp. TaxID=2888761 RepID=UPI003BAC5A14